MGQECQGYQNCRYSYYKVNSQYLNRGNRVVPDRIVQIAPKPQNREQRRRPRRSHNRDHLITILNPFRHRLHPTNKQMAVRDPHPKTPNPAPKIPNINQSPQRNLLRRSKYLLLGRDDCFLHIFGQVGGGEECCCCFDEDVELLWVGL